MVKKINNKIKIDYENCILENSLLQIKNKKNVNNLELIEAWLIDINPIDSPKVLGLIKGLSTNDKRSLLHLKRLQRFGEQLTVILCSTDYLEESEILSSLETQSFTYNNLRTKKVPHHCPGTKELSLKWSREYWPIIWKGNPNDQILNDVKLDINIVKEHLNQIAEESNRTTGETLPIITSIVDPNTNEIVAISKDNRASHPLHHSVMRCIDAVSEKEKEKKQKNQNYDTHYLCNGFHVYTTHEPCSMCSMALIHSRISRLIYLTASPSTGALDPESGDGHTIHDHSLLNSSFEVWKWVGSDHYRLPSLKEEVNA
ncbi:tRNA-specific adenosine deaminase subunit TAD3 [Wickerhamomyces ciferrii]|uniref:tRNA-specific adenosine deaminase subunit TAD3 n=1 Tax=Wickerhamomyces ciferrii (strain ATCC 14091 / BCRC 22168 / CBS 111 / JCM 3599 / NBRC 0793 / NRRL Y-1031 F-60-10) TaxID=1206466 RepID=K0KI08_WICCF|nr:tRNA-specific adenosine deaminase subunit TAD3 [Wickerhamomyces ciferrii]CCH40768.1 tRNA-specific adenosine deaminase subunit TAD3 [Wickerhamomyces ciferrii]